MKAKNRQSGISMMEMAVVIATIVLLVGIGVPAVRALFKSFETEAGAKGVINAALSTARTIALKNQKYAGIRFQKLYQSENLLKAVHYLTFIIQDPNLDDSFTFSKTFHVAYGFRAAEGIEPIKLPDSVGVMEAVDLSDEIDDDDEVQEKTTFSIVFSSTGKLVTHDVQVLRKNLSDTVFNEPGSGAMFTDDYYDDDIFHKEPSHNNFVIYDRIQFEKLGDSERFDYLQDMEHVYINAYIGTIISKD